MNKLEIITAEELIKRDFNVPEGTGLRLSDGDNPFYLVGKDGLNQMYVRKDGENNASYILIDLNKSSHHKNLITFGKELHIEEAKPEVVDNYLKQIGVAQ